MSTKVDTLENYLVLGLQRGENGISLQSVPVL